MSTYGKRIRAMAAGAVALGLGLGGFAGGAAAGDVTAPPNGVKGYVLTGFFWGLYETKARTECANGLNAGPRDQIRAQFPDATAGQLAPNNRTLEEIFIRREAGNFWPELWDDKLNPLPWIETTSKVSYGLNLDGKVKASDFTSPDGEPGIDNELYRVIACVTGFRENGSIAHAGDEDVRTLNFDRRLMELTGVDSMIDDDDVTVTFYRGLDPVIMDGTGQPLVGTTQHIDQLRGRNYIHRLKGRITNGVLTTEPGDILFPWNNNEGYQVLINMLVKGTVMRVKLTEDRGEGVMAGYADIETFFDNMARGRHTEVHRGYTNPGFWKQMYLRADGYPDENGKNTAISSAMLVKFTQAFIEHPPATTASAK